MNDKKLLIILVVLLGLYLISRVSCDDESSNFDPQLTQLDTATIDRVIIRSKTESYQTIELDREKKGWRVKCDGQDHKAVGSLIQQILLSSMSLKAKSVVGQGPEDWIKAEVGDSCTANLRFHKSDKMLKEIVIGGISFNPEMRTASTYVRVPPDDRVYLVDGFLSMSLNVDCASLVDSSIFKQLDPFGPLN